MARVSVRILHLEPGSDGGSLGCWLADARTGLAKRHSQAFRAAGADDIRVLSGPPDDMTFGARLRSIVEAAHPEGLVVLGSGAIPLATPRDILAFVEGASRDQPYALANNRYSADVVAISRAEAIAAMPDLPSDNALPRWLEEVAGYEVADLRGRWRLAVDLDSPLDAVLSEAPAPNPPFDPAVLRDRMRAVAAVAWNRRAELILAGRTSASTLVWLERHTAARVRAIVEERGLRAGSALALAKDSGSRPPGRPPRSILGMILDRDGPGSIGRHLAQLGDGAVIDTRVLLAHRLGVDERGWPPPEERFASDLLVPDRIADPWLRELTAAALHAPIPILLGGHSLVGPGIRLLLGSNTARRQGTTSRIG
ncbi:MAG TPA: hypothetical protein VIM30_05525 [Candidatus Limnocylindrales bacterium]|jgi:hypothetical protein